MTTAFIAVVTSVVGLACFAAGYALARAGEPTEAERHLNHMHVIALEDEILRLRAKHRSKLKP